jgi:hypothetical protein
MEANLAVRHLLNKIAIHIETRKICEVTGGMQPWRIVVRGNFPQGGWEFPSLIPLPLD